MQSYTVTYPAREMSIWIYYDWSNDWD